VVSFYNIGNSSFLFKYIYLSTEAGLEDNTSDYQSKLYGNRIPV